MRIFSGIRPTGELHIGNYLGAIKQWLALQKRAECIFCIVDLHAITTPYEPKELQKNIKKLFIAYLAAGLNPKKSIFFIQSQIKEHSELAWLLGTITPLGELKRMTQFKEKAKKHPEYINVGLLNYPLLMASDILIYNTDLVPVGKDQQQHVELSRLIARKFNNTFGKVFKEPKVFLAKSGAKIMSLTEPTKKMSKTDNPNSSIDLFDKAEDIRKKIMVATTDSEKIIKYDALRKPGISNLLTIYSCFSNKPIKEIEKEFKNIGYRIFKEKLSQLLIEKLEIFRKKEKEFKNKTAEIEKILKQGEKRAQIIASATMKKVKEKMGLSK
ncbi:tryptophan--tRNA ligase [bacterium (Candidatus Gribaldobacteria) CG07_land_8_20_14_0_80_33_18]|uniref:Tryptophan--tRNA ligase n=1 Tax=bacterium (Candidatus Gribaldobacteria) CG07_land_8_20_14_0_80_33_18 TaxID=2014272 RepID=A0A2M6Z3A2_9BACT|nr:MAG: tryptophan--tRNA ligase [bacterium (Candidatus Gribaldobacteria) CG10_big_fil_rev_8_21_14_0_10_33_41]PIU46888.1 MAG: tryptophan--tRNA ligase [bacterium (Candidatus Gribaldobacteria) CG07_land_8_20_14_0_80_33_18]PJA01133.1 MAG: tryptophan--tRNA ligase [bacterium (Candidatus Gribaldobacteria) CG_4_10_14_0_2_um_filter_33_15]PJB08811.1 MAG: tryptophan--tRNA ligase [bacterium (Candidatus Gribaldobacteria) CG_4_9_14_3_um_filter_33_9]